MDEIPDPIATVARERFGVAYLFPLQRMVIANILDAVLAGAAAFVPDGPSAPERPKLRQLVLLPTGFGKSLCFQLPALLAPGPTLVVYPLLALMSDQKRRLDSCGISSALFRGGMDTSERLEQEGAVKKGEAKIVITNPESLRSERLKDFLAGADLSHIAIDEAHCVSEWGESFRPAYLELGQAIAALDPPAVSAFTATASPTVSESVSRSLFGTPTCLRISADPDRPNIHFSVATTLERTHTLLRLVRSMEKPLIVFCSSREGSKTLAEKISSGLGLDTRFYHAGLERSEKTKVEEWFLHSQQGVLVATCAYGMGVDKKNIRSVVHFDSPPSVEAYLQEAGRAGRDGLPARAVLVHAACAAPDREGGLRAERRLALRAYADAATCRRDFLMRLMGAGMEGPCSGCDVCGGGPGSPEGLGEIMEFFTVNARRFDTAEATRLLTQGILETKGPSGDPPLCAGSGLLTGWSRRETRSLIAEALRRHYLEKYPAFPWKGRIRVAARIVSEK